mmetsp:Transcript_15941/g.30230  ORF Transcript_15941/g.30230 Transcript_15941/m.30230 type:complete len:223 (-) Transcript_15941:134-802(-)
MVELCRSRSFRTPLGLQRPRRRTWLSWRPPSPRTPPGRRRGCAPTSPTGARNGRGGGARRQAKSASNKKRRASRWAMGGRDAKDCGLFPLHVTECSFLRGLLGWEAFTFFGVILFADKVPEGDTVRHETIHYLQYRELAFLGMPVLYMTALLAGLCVYTWRGRCESVGEVVECAYMANPFEREAYFGEGKRRYLNRRRPFSWWKYVGSFPPEVRFIGALQDR